ncbi:Peptidase S64, Ssy5 [Penicillium italicum]|uniref:Peptidase S64, Ssy5 n=1 Tax=Penicillium italicum TaxID=40296 RepID=A0A0A2L942_PENIT|nr:Peptidase S64, Ssy5 [Penicillium italicum]
MSSTATSSAFSKASSHSLSFCSTSEASSPFGGASSVDRHGFLKSSHRVGGPNLCSLPAYTSTNVPSRFRTFASKTENCAKSILEHLSLQFVFVELVGRWSKINQESEPILTILAVMPDQPNPDTWYRAVRQIHTELQEKVPKISVELIEEKLYNGIYCSPVNSSHPIFSKWPSIVEYILSHCDTRDWTALECWRYGTDTVRERNPVTVIVQVLETSTNPFITAARHLHGILAYFELAEVDVLFQRDTNRQFIEDPSLPVDVCSAGILPGVSLGIHQCSAGTSTLGGLVQLQFANNPQWRTFALTCFHAIWPPENHRDIPRLNTIANAQQAIKSWEFLPLDPREPKTFPDIAEQILRVDHPSLRDLKNTIQQNDSIIASIRTQRFLEYEEEINKGKDGWLPESAKSAYHTMVQRIQATEQARAPFITMRDSGNYFLGYVYAGSGVNRTRKTRRANEELRKQLRTISTDWALIDIESGRLRPQQHGDGISDHKPFNYGRRVHFSGPFGYDPDLEAVDGLELQKSGRSSGITSGTYSKLECVQFTHLKTDQGMAVIIPTFEYKIASRRGTDFAEKGDSGSWVYTLGGEVLGMLKGGNESHGTGTMTLMSDIFDDIKSVTGATQVRIAPPPNA